MARRARAASAARMLEVNTKVHGDVQKRLRQPVTEVLQLPVLELHRLSGLVSMNKRYFWH
jgi:hypothetical protein